MPTHFLGEVYLTLPRPYALGLYRGLSLNWLKTMPNVAIYMSLYDILKLQLRGRLTHGTEV